MYAGVESATDGVVEGSGRAATKREGESCKVNTGNDGTIGAGALSVKDFDAVEGALGDTKVCATDGTSAVGTSGG